MGEENISKKFYKQSWFIVMAVGIVLSAMGFLYGQNVLSTNNKIDNAVWKNNIEEGQKVLKQDIRNLDSLYSEKNRVVNLRVNDMGEVLRVVVENQEIMINQQNNVIIVVSKMCKRIDGMADDAQFLKIKEAGSMINEQPKIDHYKKPMYKDNADMLIPSAFDSTFGQFVFKIPNN